MFRLLLSSVLVFILTAGSYAAVYPSMDEQCDGDNVFVPCEPNAWDMGADLLMFTERQGAASFLRAVGPRLGTGFRVQGAYHYTHSNELLANWAHYNVTTGLGATTAENASRGVLSGGPINYQSQFDIVNLLLGQFVSMGERWDWQAFAGLQYAHLENNLSASLGILNPTQATSWRLGVDSLGPNAGFYGSFYLDEGVSIYAKSSYSVLSGSETVNTVGCTANTAVSPSTQGHQNIMMTHAMIQLGFKYQKLISQGQLTFRGGYESHNFMSPVPVGTGSIESVRGNIFYKSLAWNGGYVGLVWLGLS